MARTEEQKRDAYYTKKYGVGLPWYEAKFEEQGRACGICRRPQETFANRLAIDHDHGWRRSKIEYFRHMVSGWVAFARYLGQSFEATGKKKGDAGRGLRQLLKKASCRGLLCPFCNRGLRYYADDPSRLANASEYLQRHQNVG